MKFTTSSLLVLLPLVSAHFEMISPKPRGKDENQMPSFPCGGFNDVSSTRASLNPQGGTITISFGHTVTNIEVLLAIGANPGNAFNTILRRPFLATGLGEFCIDNLVFPSNITSGTPATIQVQSNGDPSGGLYSCVDVTLDTAAPLGTCNKGNVQVGAAEVSGHPNGTAFSGAAPGGSSPVVPSPTAATTTPAATSSTPASGAGYVKVGASSLVLGVVGALVFGL